MNDLLTLYKLYYQYLEIFKNNEDVLGDKETFEYITMKLERKKKEYDRKCNNDTTNIG